MHNSASAGRQIPGHVRQQQFESVIIDDVDVGAIAWRDAAAIAQAVKFCGIAGHHPHRSPQFDLWAQGAIARPED
jgi:hypothetical protein